MDDLHQKMTQQNEQINQQIKVQAKNADLKRINLAHGSMAYLICGSVLSVVTMNACAETDAFLAEQSVENPKVTQALISEVKQDSQKPLSDQWLIHDQKAIQQANEIKKENLEANAVSDYELKRKTDPAKLINADKHEYIPTKPVNTTYNISYESKNIKIGNQIKE